jgi:hypothetical protein
MDKSKNPTLQVRVPVWIAQSVEELAQLQGVSSAEICRQALHNYLEQRAISAPGLKSVTAA